MFWLSGRSSARSAWELPSLALPHGNGLLSGQHNPGHRLQMCRRIILPLILKFVTEAALLRAALRRATAANPLSCAAWFQSQSVELALCICAFRLASLEKSSGGHNE